MACSECTVQLKNAVELVHVGLLELDTTCPKASIDVPAATALHGRINSGCCICALTAARSRGNSGLARRNSHTTSTKGAVSAGMPIGCSAADTAANMTVVTTTASAVY